MAEAMRAPGWMSQAAAELHRKVIEMDPTNMQARYQQGRPCPSVRTIHKAAAHCLPWLGSVDRAVRRCPRVRPAPPGAGSHRPAEASGAGALHQARRGL